jgi:hypothetical protein
VVVTVRRQLSTVLFVTRRRLMSLMLPVIHHHSCVTGCRNFTYRCCFANISAICLRDCILWTVIQPRFDYFYFLTDDLLAYCSTRFLIRSLRFSSQICLWISAVRFTVWLFAARFKCQQECGTAACFTCLLKVLTGLSESLWSCLLCELHWRKVVL